MLDTLAQIGSGVSGLGLPAQAGAAVTCVLIGAKLVMSMYEQVLRINEKRAPAQQQEEPRHCKDHCPDHDGITKENAELKAKVIALEYEQGHSKTLIEMMQQVINKIDVYSEQLFDRMRAVERVTDVHTEQITELKKG